MEELGIVGQATDDNILQRWEMRFACCITGASDGHSEYIIFPLQQMLREHAPKLRYTYISCLVNWVSNE